MPTPKRKLFICVTEHCDLMWRRCFDRDFTFKGQNFVSYADLEAFYIIENIKLCHAYSDYHFTIESPAMLQKFLEKYPEHLPSIQQLFKEQKVFVPFTGNNIIDSNLVGGETIIRNFLSGYTYLKNNFGITPYGVDRCDAFGNSAQLPQIVKKFGSSWIYNTKYTKSDKLYWRGLDDSTVLIYDPKRAGSTGGYFKYRPCPACHGYKDHDCPVCHNMRIDLKFMETLRSPISDTLQPQEDAIPTYIYCGGEEMLPNEYIIEWAKQHKDLYDISFVDFDSYVPYLQDMIQHADAASEEEIHHAKELNPNNSGCYVTRIRTKQLTRSNEYQLLAAETLSTAHWLAGYAYPSDKLQKIWDALLFTAFHDAVTATHVDPAYEEFLDHASFVAAQSEEITQNALLQLANKDTEKVSVFNPYGQTVTNIAQITLTAENDITLYDASDVPVCITDYKRNGTLVTISFLAKEIPAFSTAVYTICKTNVPFHTEKHTLYDIYGLKVEPILTNDTEIETDPSKHLKKTLENEFFRIRAVENGIQEIYDKRLGRVISAESEYMVGEWILEHDEGSPWTTHSMDMRRQKMRQFTTLFETETTDDMQKLSYFIRPGERDGYAILGLTIKYSVILYKNDDKVHFSADVYWHTQNYRLRIAVPTLGTGKHFYEIPYGVLEREPYRVKCAYYSGCSDWANASGDYPAHNWAGVQNTDYSIALFNKGTPSYQIQKDEQEKATIYLSVLRSPSLASYLNSPLEYTMTDYDGMRDCGEHHFEYALKAYAEGFDKNDAVTDGISYNTNLLCHQGTLSIPMLPTLECEDAHISSIKLAEDQKGLVLRLCEHHGKDTQGTLILPDTLPVAAIYETDLKEENRKECICSDNKVLLPFKHFEIKTLYIALKTVLDR